jgi:hypothetical protein
VGEIGVQLPGGRQQANPDGEVVRGAFLGQVGGGEEWLMVIEAILHPSLPAELARVVVPLAGAKDGQSR